ncbi:helix-turn-helix domain-containing protein [Convivina intestini]|uniref:SOS-response transcriptional repressor LexA n=1 Tax=Convivina intestini TaxID=1505726 RepID=A0A2U1D5W8_9LACO|nr:XRE family transcriptional regulator [Convivina intestini]PVY83081.1 SOS-response transcriptional repressor LexA [Convivina intestini]CAH1851162.1 hypothetical protein R078131_00237 [Convivina intestini]CAH1856573.1 hypothetical protein R077811_01282 [Convivina intestini]SDB98302.1 Helix-turn-helix [Leuconostocaceae bacterium R-53105]
MVSTNKNFGNTIRNIRLAKGFSIRQVALQAGMANSYISQLENAKRNIPKPETLYKLAHGLRVSNEEMLSAAGIIQPHLLTTSEISMPKSNDFLPVYRQISSGYPQGAQEDIDGRIRVNDDLLTKYGLENLLAFRVRTDGMNRIIPKGAIAILAKVTPSKIMNGDIEAVIIGIEAATLRHVYSYPDRIRLESDTWLSDSFKTLEYRYHDFEKNSSPIKIIGKLVQVIINFE